MSNLDPRKAYSRGSGTLTDPVAGQVHRQLRRRCTTAEINAGGTLLAARKGWKYRLHDAKMIAIGGAASGATDVRILGTQSGSGAALLAVAIAALTQSAVVRAGAANATVLADGVSFVACDHNTPITFGKTGGSLATSTAVDIFIEYETVKA